MDVQESFELFENIPSINENTDFDRLAWAILSWVSLQQHYLAVKHKELSLPENFQNLDRKNSLYSGQPTTGLHFDDINKLLLVLQRFVDMGNSVVVIEHNLGDQMCRLYY